jgi:hyaluronan synthase
MSAAGFIFLLMMLATFYSYGQYLGLWSIVFNRKAYDIKKDWNYRPKVTIMLSVFNEGEEVYKCVKSIMQSNYPMELVEIIAYDDCSPDDSYIWLCKIQSEYPNNILLRKNEVNSGKCFNLCQIAEEATGEILISIDSDTIFDPDAIRNIVACYADPIIGAVGGQVRVKNVNDSLWSQLQTIQYAFVFQIFKTIENKYKTARCLCGPLVSFRKDLYLKLLPSVRKRHFLGSQITYGEDTFLTSLICFGIGLDKPYRVFNELSAIGWTGTPATLTTYLNQQIRWRRGTLVGAVFTSQNLFSNIMAGGPAAAIMHLVPGLIGVTVLTFCVYLFMAGMFLSHLLPIIMFMASAGVIKCAIYNATMGREDKMGKVNNPFLTGVLLGAWNLVSWLVLNIFATFTMDDPGWVTRQNQGNVR